MTSRPRILTIVIAGSLALAGCGKSMSDRAAELAVQAATGNKVDVSKSGNEMTVKTDQGVMKASSGNNLTVPAEFPTDVHLPKTAYTISNVVQMGHTIILTLHSPSTMNELYVEYDTTMKSAGWKEAMAMQSSQAESLLSFQKDNRVVTVTLAAQSGQGGGTNVSLQHLVQ